MSSTPGSPTRRSLAPDLARGFMLLFIALVNAQFFLTHADTVRGTGDQVLTFVQSLLVNGRAIPLFSLLFGYGMVWIARRITESGGGWVHARTVLHRRGLWMLLIGLVHGVLLLPVDIVGAYGLALLLFLFFLRVGDRTLLWAAGAFAVGSATLNLLLTYTLGGGQVEEEGAAAHAAVPSLVEADFVAAMGARLAEWVLYTPVTLLFTVMAPLLVGVWAGRHRVLEHPELHRTLLVRTVVVGLGIAVAGGLPDALVSASLVPNPGPVVEPALWVLHDAAGWAGGAGWAALIALVALRSSERGVTDHPLVVAVAAVGERSLSCYLAQAAVFTLVFAPYGLGLGAAVSASAAAGVAVATWAATLVWADLSRRRGGRGPAETLLRRRVYAGVHLPGRTGE
ncbi:DUF418 domain-containing protein [Nocardiopsis sp. JB363]|uniref:DUF418 domain-containing protein n=1 Tax=Nocardiopsis sp. JB363 TaxID=1434837 RepID=UPI00097AD407|nr:DUF418 domain-containing protein [Nocardiopsis sp. JB363]SIO87603.1 10 TMS hypothetical membrane protein [Nocardiopsis sp. JB363]